LDIVSFIITHKIMEYIRKSIYNLPEIRHTLLPFWTGWILTAIGVLCGVLFFMIPNASAGWSSTFVGMMVVGGCSFVTIVCYYLFGDSRRPYSRQLHAVLEPTYTYYSAMVKDDVVAALEAHDEDALSRVKKSAQPELALVRYSDRDERVFYSQLTRAEGNKYIPLTDIIVSGTAENQNNK